ncbi:hypothetical protein I0P70_13655 [Pontibacter sp. FD36]|uniref:hypothetical protein n=1 Tax=Pontibacter sp. FD36 TaxID=2789860 RepID=UPI0018AB775B|nr:hypothetical protein [Pontibacter sp. FD36]MBF8964295.1 hypothetical protein [Pontibacter sp. FD36]
MEIRDITINSREDISAFFHYLITDLNLNFHPDNSFYDYVNPDGTTTFTEEQTDHFEAILEGCFVYCHVEGEDIYEIGLEVFYKCLTAND